MFENIIKFFNKTKRKEEKEHANSKNAAKERLHLVLMQDRANVSVDFLELMKQEIIDVIKKYIEVDEKAIDVRLTSKENEDGTNGAPALYANIPIVGIKNEARKISKKVEESQKQEENIKNKEEEEKEELQEKIEDQEEEKEEEPQEEIEDQEEEKEGEPQEEIEDQEEDEKEEEPQEEIEDQEEEEKEGEQQEEIESQEEEEKEEPQEEIEEQEEKKEESQEDNAKIVNMQN